MPYPGHGLDLVERMPGEQRLFDYFWPANCAGSPPEYFRESIELLKTVENREAEVIARLREYLKYVNEPALSEEIATLICTLAEKKAKKEKGEKRRARTKR